MCLTLLGRPGTHDRIGMSPSTHGSWLSWLIDPKVVNHDNHRATDQLSHPVSPWDTLGHPGTLWDTPGTQDGIRPVGLMVKASASGAGGSRFESREPPADPMAVNQLSTCQLAKMASWQVDGLIHSGAPDAKGGWVIMVNRSRGG